MSDPVKLVTRPVMVQEDVVEILKEWLIQAEEGQLECIALAGVLHDRGMLRTSISFTRHRGAQLGAVSLLQHRLAKELFEA